MKKWYLHIVLICVGTFFFTCYGALAQQKKLVSKQVSWTYQVKKISDTEYDLVFKAEINKGLHMYSQHIGDGGPIPTSFSFNKSADYTLVDSVKEKTKPVRVHDKMFDMDLIYFFDAAEFVQHVKIKPGLKTITGTLEFMTCDDTKCFPPTTLDFRFQLAE